MRNLDYEWSTKDSLTFTETRHSYEISDQPSHGRHTVTLSVPADDSGESVILHIDRVDLASERSRNAFADTLNGRSDDVRAELKALFLALPDRPVDPNPAPATDGGYRIVDGRICGWKAGLFGGDYVPLCNFQAQISEEIISDDGLLERGELELRGYVDDGTVLPPVRVSAARFPRMEWVISNWGTKAIVVAGQGNTDRLREAIQRLSPNVHRRREYIHSGWRRIDDRWVYLTAGAVIDANGTVDGIAVRLQGSQERLALPAPPTGDELRQAIRASIDLLDVAPDAVTAPLLGGTFRAPLNEVRQADSGIIVHGQTGTGKSEVVALHQQHFGADYDRLNLPASWESTANALEAQAFRFKDAVLVIDDYVPTGDPRDDRVLNQKMGRVARGGGNRSGRGRMNADGSLRPDYQPRAQIIVTAEDLPRGQSILARNTLLELRHGDVHLGRLTIAQRQARDGIFTKTMAGYIQFLAGRLDTIRDEIAEQLATIRDAIRTPSMHGRTPEAAAQWLVGWHYFTEFAESAGAITPEESRALWHRVETAITGVAGRQAEHHQAEDPVARFLQSIEAALANGDAHIDSAAGDEPDNPAAWGWELRRVGTGDFETDRWTRRGQLIGWQRGEDLWLEPEAAFAVAQAMAVRTGSPIAVQPRTLYKRMAERKLIVSADDGRNTLKQTLAGARRRVILISTRHIYPDLPGQSGQSGHEQQKQAGFREISTQSPLIENRGSADGERGNRGTERAQGEDAPLGSVCLGCGRPLDDGRNYYCDACEKGKETPHAD